MSKVQVKQHPVTALRVTQISAMKRGAQIVSPDAGVVLTLEDNSSLRWLLEGNSVPAIGSVVIKDDLMHTQYLVTASEFAELFTVTAD